MIKLRIKLGNLNYTDQTDSDRLNWGFQNLKKMKKVILGFNRNELRNFPLRDIDNSIEVIGSVDGWERRMVCNFTKFESKC